MVQCLHNLQLFKKLFYSLLNCFNDSPLVVDSSQTSPLLSLLKTIMETLIITKLLIIGLNLSSSFASPIIAPLRTNTSNIVFIPYIPPA